MDGIIIVNKPKGLTSHDVVNIVKKTLNTKKVGHTGTLDPNATGVLPILVGKATKISKYLIEHDKEYIAKIYLGEKRNTADVEGNIVQKDEEVLIKLKSFTLEKIEQILNSFLGKQKQIPPIYSSIKINGKKAYEYARSGQTIEMPERDIEIYSIEFIKLEENILTFKVLCSKGTYIRTLCEDIANKMGTIGYMLDLTRTKLDRFNIENSISIEDLKKHKEHIITIEEVFKEKERIVLDDRKTELFMNGVQLTFAMENDIYRIYNNKQFIGLGVIKNDLLKRDVVLV